MLGLLALLPWAAMLVVALLLLRRRPRIADYAVARVAAGAIAPRVSAIVPARDEAESVGGSLATLLDSSYPNYEILLVDDGSRDGTGEIARVLAERSRGAIRVVTAPPLPSGWVGKAWACWQGYLASNGDVLLFTSADARQDSDLLGHAVTALEAERAAAVTLVPGQPLVRFWDRLVLPQLWLAAALLEAVRRRRRGRLPEGAATGEFFMVRRGAYERIGGHESQRGEVRVERIMATRLAEADERVFAAHAEDLLESRVYPSLSAIAQSWSKRLSLGARRGPRAAPARLWTWVAAAGLVLFWLLPPFALGWSFLTGIDGALQLRALAGVGLSLLTWLVVYARLRSRRRYALLYPLGLVVTGWIVLRSALRNGRIRWKGREY